MERSIIGAGYMHDAERRNLKARLLNVARDKLNELVENEGYTYTELSGIIGVPNSRISEVVTMKTKTLQDAILLQMINRGLLTMKEIVEGLDEVSEKEERWLQDLAIHQNEHVLRVARMLMTVPTADVKFLADKLEEHKGLTFIKRRG